jgi:fumarate reductase subunit D
MVSNRSDTDNARSKNRHRLPFCFVLFTSLGLRAACVKYVILLYVCIYVPSYVMFKLLYKLL